MYIRSQNKKMIIPMGNSIISTACNNEMKIIVWNIDDNEDNFIGIGEYKTSERAEEILDEIQNAIQLFNSSTKSLDLSNYNNGVYNMPSE